MLVLSDKCDIRTGFHRFPFKAHMLYGGKGVYKYTYWQNVFMQRH